MAAIALKLLAWSLKNWRIVLAGLLVALIVGSIWRHVAADNRMKAERDVAVAERKAMAAEHAALQRSLAEADTAAKVAIAAKVEAEKAAAKRLRERDEYWRRVYAQDPEAAAWAADRLPDLVRRGLRVKPSEGSD